MTAHSNRSWQPIGRVRTIRLEELDDFASQLYRDEFAPVLQSARNILCCLEGELGAGKTTFSASLGRALGVTDNINSPTFNLLNQYDGETVDLNHFDLYRLGSSLEAAHAGFGELWAQHAGAEGRPVLQLIEWWQRAGDLIVRTQTPLFKIVLEHQDDSANATQFDVNQIDAARRVSVFRYV